MTTTKNNNQDEIIKEIENYLSLKDVEQQLSTVKINNYQVSKIKTTIQPRGELDSKNYSIFFSHQNNDCILNLIEIYDQNDILMIKNELRIFFPILFLKELFFQIAYWNRPKILDNINPWVEKMTQQGKLKQFYFVESRQRQINVENQKKVFWLNFIEIYIFILQTNNFKIPEYSPLLAEYGFTKDEQKELIEFIKQYFDDIGGIKTIKKIMSIFQDLKNKLDYNFVLEVFSIISDPALRRLLSKFLRAKSIGQTLEDELILRDFIKKIKTFHLFKEQKELLPSIYIKELILLLQDINQNWLSLSQKEKDDLKFKLASQ